MNLIDSIGKTPIVNLKTNESIWIKLERFNPAGSVKDRAAFGMISRALETGILKGGSTIVEPTSGNTGIALSMLGGYYGLKVILTMPENLSVERRKMLSVYGAELILTPASEGMPGAIKKAEEIVKERDGVMLNQFENPANPGIHFMTTGPEILSQMRYRIDAIVAGVGTGGTLTGTGRFLKGYSEKIKIYAVEPSESPVLSGGTPSKHGIQGIGAGFVPGNYDPSVIDGVITVNTDEAWETAKDLSKKEGLFLGVSSGAAVAAAMKLSKELARGSRIVAIAPDGGEKYLSVW